MHARAERERRESPAPGDGAAREQRMRIVLVAHGFPPVERTGVETYTEALAAALARSGHAVAVFVPRADPDRAHGAVVRETRGAVEVHWIADNVPPDGPREALDRPGFAREFGLFLERERPDVVHFQHLVKLGVGLVFEARRRGIPTLYTAHDYYPVCHRYTLLRPDLVHCDVRGDSMACARCDLAMGFLNARSERLGDYQMGALPAQLAPEEASALAALLGGHPEGAGLDEREQDAACDLRRDLDSLRARAFVALDRIIAPTNFMARELVRGGVDKQKIHLLPFGIACEDLRDVPAIRPDLRSPVRMGYLGGLSKQKGVHVLLAAFERQRSRAELVIHGGGTDRAYVELLEREARRVGARWGGPYERADLPRLLAGLDLVVVPSIWVENYPIVIREAFAARRPVVASRLGALPESVRGGVDGLLFTPGDADDLARVLDEACAPGVLESLASNAPEVKTVERETEELVTHYRAVEHAPAARELPATLAAFVADVERLERLPTSELFSRALAGVGRLRAALVPESAAGGEALLLAALRGGSAAQTLVRDLRREKEWLEEQSRSLLAELTGDPVGASTSAGPQEPGWRALRAGVRRVEEELRSLVADLFRVSSTGSADDAAPSPTSPLPELLTALRQRRDALEAEHRELTWRRETGRSQEAELASRRDQAAELARAAESLEAEARWRKEQMDGLAREVEWRRGTMGELEGELARLREEFERARTDHGLRTAEHERRIADLARSVEALRAEADARRRELEDLAARTRRGWLRLLGRTELVRRVRAFERPEGGPA